MNQFSLKYPLASALMGKIAPVQEGFDMDLVAKTMSPANWSTLKSQLQRVFVCGHAHWPPDHPEPTKRNTEVHCIYAEDLERFLRTGHA
jgi:hypothetical protein